MPPITLEPEALSTPLARGAHDRWNSMAGEPDDSGYAPLSKFDLAINNLLDKIATLERNWDAQGAYPVNPLIIETARELISSLPHRLKNNTNAMPAVVPMRKGNLQFEWHDGQRTLEIEIETPSTIHFLRFHPEAGIEEEDIRAATDTNTLVRLIQWFVGE